ncbi:head-tail adaptor protein [Muribacter muris]|uniref:Head-tail adaptor protein n=1 Tax=Muribacter muris TaxID=67855 RepID=A0A4Y9JTA0_9PAST|nr:phage head closure protein [Muribacter muris]MBF0786100.1 phage head closure protein [Muribacter muris]MBF0826479.1 phage head closure protein [Muribacter muris]TFV07940.1 head-tail adaptor protein [Muribacter muris]
MARMVRAGKFDKVITLQKQVSRQNSYGGVIQEWQDIAQLRASIEPLQGREFFSGAVQLGEKVCRIRIRYRSNLDRTMRVKYGDRIFEITNIIDSKERHEELQLICQERT